MTNQDTITESETGYIYIYIYTYMKELTQDTRTPSPGGLFMSTGTLPVSNSRRTMP